MATRKSPVPVDSAAPASAAKKTPAKPRGTSKPSARVAPAHVEVAVPVAPEKSKKRKRLAKAFVRPLDKVLRLPPEPVREKFSLLPGEYEQLMRVKKHLAARGVVVRKSDLVRAGLFLLSSKSEEEIRALLAALPALG